MRRKKGHWGEAESGGLEAMRIARELASARSKLGNDYDIGQSWINVGTAFNGIAMVYNDLGELYQEVDFCLACVPKAMRAAP